LGAAHARIPALLGEVERAEQRLAAPVARLRRGAESRPFRLVELNELLGSGQLVVDACRRSVRLAELRVSLVTRPLLLELLVALAEVAPRSAPRDWLISRVFLAKRVNESHRVRLRVEIGRLRKLISKLARLEATTDGFVLVPHGGAGVACLLPPADGEGSALLSLLSGGEAWSTSALATAIGKSQRAVQRALGELTADGKVRALGHGPARRWIAAPTTGIATTLLLVAPGTLG
ncbi:MAG TPA: helix-turn-helix domain-containing protein, partial [Polyangiaceae bacterium]|nr:helix-turn-helix domain-containing protein [Polyangiaceae bacterium]